MNIQDLMKYDQFVGLFVGKSGGGKTSAIASFAELGPLVIMDLDRRARGMLPVLRLLPEATQRNVTIEHFDNSWASVDKFLEILKIKCKQGQGPRTLVIEGWATILKLLLQDSISLRGMAAAARQGKEVRRRGVVEFTQPDDYLYASLAVQQLMYDFFLPLRINVIFSGWIVDVYGRRPGANEYEPKEVIGEKLLLTEKLSEEVPGYFDEIYRFGKESTGIPTSPIRFYVEFEGLLAKTSRPELRGLGRVDITNKSFYEFYKSRVSTF